MAKLRSKKPAVRHISIKDATGEHADEIMAVFKAAKRRNGAGMIYTLHAAMLAYAKAEKLDIEKEA